MPVLLLHQETKIEQGAAPYSQAPFFGMCTSPARASMHVRSCYRFGFLMLVPLKPIPKACVDKEYRVEKLPKYPPLLLRE